MRAILFFAVGIAGLTTLVARPEFTGILSTSRGVQLALSDAETSTSAWVKVGQRFGAYSVVGYDPDKEIIILARDAERLTLKLKDARVREAQSSIKGSISLNGSGATQTMPAALVVGQANVFRIDEAANLIITPTVRPDGNMQYHAELKRISADGKGESFGAASIIIKPGDKFQLDGAFGYGFEFTPERLGR